MQSKFFSLFVFLGCVSVLLTSNLQSKKADKIELKSVKTIAVLPLWSHDADAAIVVHEKLILALAKKSPAEVSPAARVLDICKSRDISRGVITSDEAKQFGDALGVDAVVFGQIQDFSLRETESDIIGDTKKKELTSTLKFKFDWQIMTVADGVVQGGASEEVSERDTRTNIYKSSLSEADKDKFPAATILLIERSAKDLAKQLLSTLTFTP